MTTADFPAIVLSSQYCAIVPSPWMVYRVLSSREMVKRSGCRTSLNPLDFKRCATARKRVESTTPPTPNVASSSRSSCGNHSFETMERKVSASEGSNSISAALF